MTTPVILFILGIVLFVIIKFGVERFNWFSSFISITAIGMILLALILYFLFTTYEISKLGNEVQSSTETIVESINNNIKLLPEDKIKIINLLNNSSSSTYGDIEAEIIDTIKLEKEQKEILKSTLDVRAAYDKDIFKELISLIISFFINLATILGLYYILYENRKKQKPLKEEETKVIKELKNTIIIMQNEENLEIKKLKNAIRLLQNDTNYHQKFYEYYYENNSKNIKESK